MRFSVVDDRKEFKIGPILEANCKGYIHLKFFKIMKMLSIIID